MGLIINGATVAICRFVYMLNERIKVCETKLEHYQTELTSVKNLFIVFKHN
jgi:hypothetical protein